jgi:hypothetical protein
MFLTLKLPTLVVDCVCIIAEPESSIVTYSRLSHNYAKILYEARIESFASTPQSIECGEVASPPSG